MFDVFDGRDEVLKLKVPRGTPGHSMEAGEMKVVVGLSATLLDLRSARGIVGLI